MVGSVEVGVGAVAGQQSGVGADLGDAAAVKVDDLIGVGDGG